MKLSRVRTSVVWFCLAVSLWTAFGGTGQVILCQAADGTIEIEYQSKIACGICPEDAMRPVHPYAMAPEPTMLCSGTGCGPCVDYALSINEAVLDQSAFTPGSLAANLPLVEVVLADDPVQSLKSSEAYRIEQPSMLNFTIVMLSSIVLVI